MLQKDYDVFPCGNGIVCHLWHKSVQIGNDHNYDEISVNAWKI